MQYFTLRTGIPWRDLPERYGPYTSAYNRFNRWSRRGVWNCRIKDWRRIATRYDKLARNFLAAAALIGALYWIKL